LELVHFFLTLMVESVRFITPFTKICSEPLCPVVLVHPCIHADNITEETDWWTCAVDNKNKCGPPPVWPTAEEQLMPFSFYPRLAMHEAFTSSIVTLRGEWAHRHPMDREDGNMKRRRIYFFNNPSWCFLKALRESLAYKTWLPARWGWKK
jgi:hypothetical protein